MYKSTSESGESTRPRERPTDLVLAYEISNATYARMRRVLGDEHLSTRQALSFRDHVVDIFHDARQIVAEYEGSAEELSVKINKNATWAAASQFKAMGASKAEILAVLPVFRRFRTHIAPPYLFLQHEYKNHHYC